MRKRTNPWLAMLLAALLAGNAWADPPGHRRGHHYDHPVRPHADQRSGVRIGITFGTSWPVPPPHVHFRQWPHFPHPGHFPHWPSVYVAPVVPVVVVPPRPVYVERQPVVPTLEPGYWYYCNEAQAYYPYVQQCAGSWVKVTPQAAR